MQRRALMIVIGLLAVALVLDVSGIAPGAGELAVPFLVLLAAALILWRALRPSSEAGVERALHIPRGTAQAARLEVLIGAADLTIGGGAEAETLVNGVCRGVVRQHVDVQPEATAIKLNQPFSLTGRAHADWRLTLAEGPWRAVRVEMVSTHARLDLSGLAIERLVLEMGGGTLDATLPRGGEASLQISGGRATVHIPEGTAVEIVNEIRLGEVLVDTRRFTPDPSGLRWMAGEIQPGTEPLRLTLKGGLGTIEVRGGPATPAR